VAWRPPCSEAPGAAGLEPALSAVEGGDPEPVPPLLEDAHARACIEFPERLGAEDRGGEEGRRAVQDDCDRVPQPRQPPGRDEGQGEGGQKGAGDPRCPGPPQDCPAEGGGTGEPECAGGEKRLV